MISMSAFYTCMNISFRSLTLGCFIVLAGCGSPKQLEGFDSAAWKSDRMGCQGTRKSMRGQSDAIRLQLRGLSQDEVLDVLGKPDFQRLYQRNQKFYVYFVEPGPQCEGRSDASQARTLILRLSAIELVTEAYYETGKPF